MRSCGCSSANGGAGVAENAPKKSASSTPLGDHFPSTGEPWNVKLMRVLRTSPRGVLEADFFGAFSATPAPPFADEQPQLRIRFAYADLTNGRTTIRFGQFWSPLFGEVPVSVTHVAFPLGYGATGMIGWRFPGLYLYHDLN